MTTKQKNICTYTLRIIVGAIFIFSGIAKTIDPWGSIYKIAEYLSTWGIASSRELLLIGAIALATTEFTLGILTVSGCLRRTTPWLLLGMMTVMLPLTLYIWIYNPVSDCGCFGDAIILSNGVTFAKNIIITALIILLIPLNPHTPGLIRPISQWLTITVTIAYCLTIALYGYLVQPLIDFRPNPVGTTIDPDDPPILVFPITDDHPDDPFADTHNLMLILVSDPEYHSHARASMLNRINEYITAENGTCAAILGCSDSQAEKWAQDVDAKYPIYTADDTEIKMLARGDAALVHIADGRIAWKYNLYSLPGDFPDNNTLATTRAIDTGTRFATITAIYIILLALTATLRTWRKTKKPKKTP